MFASLAVHFHVHVHTYPKIHVVLRTEHPLIVYSLVSISLESFLFVLSWIDTHKPWSLLPPRNPLNPSAAAADFWFSFRLHSNVLENLFVHVPSRSFQILSFAFLFPSVQLGSMSV